MWVQILGYTSKTEDNETFQTKGSKKCFPYLWVQNQPFSKDLGATSPTAPTILQCPCLKK